MASGLEVFLQDPPQWAKGTRMGLLTHPAAVDYHLQAARELIARRFPGQLQILFSPQHGLLGEKQDNMVASPDFLDPVLHLPVISLYGPRLAPLPNSLAEVDLLLVDLQDVGTRVYTFATTVAKVMATAASVKTRLVVLDRPNPIAGVQVEGNLLHPAWASFVGPYPLPMRHGFTLGELLLYYNANQGLGCDLKVIPAQGWQRQDYWEETGLPWVLPSPNLPTLDSALVYPGQVLLEGTNLSEGRGTTRPFELCGAPFLEPPRIKARLRDFPLPGVILRETCFEPTFHKWTGQLCRGFQLHVTDHRTFQPYLTTLALLWAIRELYPDQFAWRPPPYEYETERLPIDLLTGDAKIREGLDRGVSPLELQSSWQADLNQFLEQRQDFLLYPE